MSISGAKERSDSGTGLGYNELLAAGSLWRSPITTGVVGENRLDAVASLDGAGLVLALSTFTTRWNW